MRAFRYLIPSLLAALMLAAPPAAGHDKWLEAEPFTASTPTTTKIYLLTGEELRQAEPLPLRQRGRVTRFELVTASAHRELQPMLHEDQQPIAALPAGTLPNGTSVLLFDAAPIDILLPAEKFQSYLFSEQLMDILVERADSHQEDQPGRERYSRSVKALLQSGTKHDDVVRKPAGQDLEIIPLLNPYGLPLGNRLVVQVLFRGQPLPKRAVSFANRYHGNVVTKRARTDKYGQASVAIDRSGLWLVSLVHMERSREPAADWRSYFSSLTFELPEAAQ